jgi:ATP-binding cassette subfamily B protein/subfamily B ATP-binding cassette protein MsbA
LFACAGLVVVYLLLGGLRTLNDYTTIKIGQKMVNDLRRDLYSQIQRLSLSFHHRRQVGDLLYRLTSDTYAIQTLTMNGLFLCCARYAFRRHVFGDPHGPLPFFSHHMSILASGSSH